MKRASDQEKTAAPPGILGGRGSPPSQLARPPRIRDRMLADKVMVIIGGTSGLGFSAAQALIRAGAKVVVVGRDRKKARAAEAALGQDARALAGDGARAETAASAIDLAVEELGGFDGLYHVAGGSGRRFGDGPLDQISNRGWSDTLELNLNSLFFSNRAAVRRFLAEGTAGSVLNMTSVLGFRPSPRYFATHAYAAAKAAAVGLTLSAASFYAPRGIRFNAIAPGLIETPMSARAQQDPAIRRFIAMKQPLDGGRIGRPSDLDAAALFFLSDSSRFVTGQVLAVDGGWSVTEGQY